MYVHPFESESTCPGPELGREGGREGEKREQRMVEKGSVSYMHER